MNNVNKYDIQDGSVSKEKLDADLKAELDGKLNQDGGGDIKGNVSITGKIYFTPDGSATGPAKTDRGAIYCEHDATGETIRMVVEVSDNASDGIVLRKVISGDGNSAPPKDIFKACNDQIDINDNVNLSGVLNIGGVDIKDTISSVETKVTTNTKDIGTINSALGTAALSTTNKTIKGAINELFQNANNAKVNLASVIGSPVAASNTFDQMKTSLQTMKNTLASNISSKGVSASGGSSLNDLINLVKNISLVTMNGIQINVGEVTEYGNSVNSGGERYVDEFVTVPCPFTPRILIVYQEFPSYNYTGLRFSEEDRTFTFAMNYNGINCVMFNGWRKSSRDSSYSYYWSSEKWEGSKTIYTRRGSHYKESDEYSNKATGQTFKYIAIG